MNGEVYKMLQNQRSNLSPALLRSGENLLAAFIRALLAYRKAISGKIGPCNNSPDTGSAESNFSHLVRRCPLGPRLPNLPLVNSNALI
jgi:hypothetical protein